MAVLPPQRGTGYGRALLHDALHHAHAQQARVVWCNARATALGCYQAAGFVEGSAPFEIAKIGTHLRMDYLMSEPVL